MPGSLLTHLECCSCGLHYDIAPINLCTACPGRAAALAGVKELVAREQIEKDEAVVVFNTGSAFVNSPEATPSLPVVREAEDVRSRLRGRS